ncbi:hypothetical protein J2X03_000820, partial [Microbacterium trichothecenolyticum]|nr:hypothetical protein [Microbacterium trichothecenolyticum]
STMTKNEYQTDIHELIQKRPPPTKKWSTEKKLAFDKCTLLSSQRSDAPAFQLHSHHRRATSLSYPIEAIRQTDRSSSSGKPIVQHAERLGGDGGGSLLEGSQTLRPSALPFGANKKTLPRECGFAQIDALHGCSPPAETSPRARSRRDRTCPHTQISPARSRADLVKMGLTVGCELTDPDIRNYQMGRFTLIQAGSGIRIDQRGRMWISVDVGLRGHTQRSDALYGVTIGKAGSKSSNTAASSTS